MSIHCFNCDGAHESAAAVRACYATRTSTDDRGEAWLDRKAEEGTAVKHENHPRKQPNGIKIDRDGIYRDPATGEIWKAQWNRASGDGRRLYAKQLVMTRWDVEAPMSPEAAVPKRQTMKDIHLGLDVAFDNDGWEMEWHFVRGAVMAIEPEWRLTPAEAEAFGSLYGKCIRCGRPLTLEESIDRGMGSTCAGKQF